MSKIKNIAFLLLLIGVVIVSGCVNNQVSSGNIAASEQQSQPNSETVNQQKVSVCKPNWQCSSWSSCTPSGTQTRTCTDSDNCGITTNKPIESQSCEYIVYSPEYIKSFKIEEVSGVLIPYFALEDKNGTNTLGEGKASIQIKNTDGKSVFTQELNFKPSDFIESEIQNNLKIYRWNINTTNIQKGNRNTGTADLNLTLSDGKIIKDTYSGFSIPSYTHAELEKIWEDEYNKNAKISREVINKGNFEVTLVKYGFYTYQPSLFGVYTDDKVTVFRADVEIKNIDSVRNKFYTIGAKVISDSKEYDVQTLFSEWSGLETIEPGFLKEGYLKFLNVPQNLTGQIKILVGSDEKVENFYEFTATL